MIEMRKYPTVCCFGGWGEIWGAIAFNCWNGGRIDAEIMFNIWRAGEDSFSLSTMACGHGTNTACSVATPPRDENLMALEIRLRNTWLILFLSRVMVSFAVRCIDGPSLPLPLPFPIIKFSEAFTLCWNEDEFRRSPGVVVVGMLKFNVTPRSCASARKP